MMICKKQSKIKNLLQFIKDFNLSIKQCYRIISSIQKATNINKGKLVPLLKCAVDNTKKLRFIQEHEASVS